MTCKKCGASLAAGARFCDRCGSSVASASKQPQDSQQDRARSRGCLRLIVFAVVIIICLALVGYVMGIFDGEELPAESYDITGGTGGSGSYVSSESGVSGDKIEVDDLRSQYTKLKGDGTDTVTVMVYICAADLESQNGCATSDILEMLEAGKADNVNIVLQTGGTVRWRNNLISSSETQRYLLADDGVYSLSANLGQLNMGEPNTLRDFIKFCAKEYPADRNILVLWDHGGGTLGGYACDENYSRSGTMQLYEVGQAIKAAGVKFDIVGFDACLMATLETAYMLEDYADYLIASEETEPGDGWFYTDWINALNKNSSISSEELGRVIIDSYIKNLSNGSEATLSIVELRRIPYLYATLCDAFKGADIASTGVNTLARARGDCKSYGGDGYDQIDLVNFVTEAKLEKADDVIDAVNSAVCYRRSKNIRIANGLAMYFPYSWLEYFSSGLAIQAKVGMGSEYTDFFRDFVSALAGGQAAGYRSTGGKAIDFTKEEWYNAELVAKLESKYNNYDFASVSVKDFGDYYAAELTREERAVISRVDLRLFFNDGDGFIDLGADSVAQYDKNGNLALTFDETWVALDDNVISYYVVDERNGEGDDWYSIGYSNVTVNGVYGRLFIRWDAEYPLGRVLGWQPRYDEEYPVACKGYFDLNEGDVLRFVLEYYDSTGAYEGDFFYDFEIVYDGGIDVGYKHIGDDFEVNIFLEITDIYGVTYGTEMVSLYD